MLYGECISGYVPLPPLPPFPLIPPHPDFLQVPRRPETIFLPRQNSWVFCASITSTTSRALPPAKAPRLADTHRAWKSYVTFLNEASGRKRRSDGEFARRGQCGVALSGSSMRI